MMIFIRRYYLLLFLFLSSLPESSGQQKRCLQGYKIQLVLQACSDSFDIVDAFSPEADTMFNLNLTNSGRKP